MYSFLSWSDLFMYSLSIRPCKKTVKKEQERGLHLDPLLDDEGAGLEPLVELLHHLGDELVVVQLLPALHDPHDARLDLVFPVLVHLVCKCRSVQVYKRTKKVQYFTFFLVSFLSGSASPARALAWWQILVNS